MQDVFLTIVVPAYNVERFLAECLDSIINQTKKTCKIVLVNDGSTDTTGEICQKYTNQFPDLITYINQENKGLGAARNAGLREVTTEYVAFLDSDDWLMPRFVEIIRERIESYYEAPELIYTLPVVYDVARNRYDDWMDKPLFKKLFQKKDIVINPKNCPSIYELEPNACRKVYQTAFLKKNNFAFPEGTKWEDVEPHFQLLHAAKHCIGEERVGFCYRINSGNQITASGGMDRLQVTSVFDRALQFGLKNGWEPEVLSRILKMMLNFSKWSVDVAKKEVRVLLAKRIHTLYVSIPKPVLKQYYADMHVTKRDKLLISLYRSGFYKLVGIPHKYEFGKKLLTKFKR